eukprot:scaffold12967_cov120-Isochrysis_galbana.AAC.4
MSGSSRRWAGKRGAKSSAGVGRRSSRDAKVAPMHAAAATTPQAGHAMGFDKGRALPARPAGQRPSWAVCCAAASGRERPRWGTAGEAVEASRLACGQERPLLRGSRAPRLGGVRTACGLARVAIVGRIHSRPSRAGGGSGTDPRCAVRPAAAATAAAAQAAANRSRSLASGESDPRSPNSSWRAMTPPTERTRSCDAHRQPSCAAMAMMRWARASGVSAAEARMRRTAHACASGSTPAPRVETRCAGAKSSIVGAVSESRAPVTPPSNATPIAAWGCPRLAKPPSAMHAHAPAVSDAPSPATAAHGDSSARASAAQQTATSQPVPGRQSASSGSLLSAGRGGGGSAGRASWCRRGSLLAAAPTAAGGARRMGRRGVVGGCGTWSNAGVAPRLALTCEVTNTPSAVRTGAGDARFTTRRRGEASTAGGGAAAGVSIAAALA